MENRSYFRTYASINLLIYKSGLPVAIGITRDISNAGLFVQTSYVDVDPSQVLEFELLYSRKSVAAHKRYRAVFHALRSDGLVLKFDETCDHDARKLAAMVEWVAHAHEKNRNEINLQRTSGQRISPNRLVRIPNDVCSVR